MTNNQRTRNELIEHTFDLENAEDSLLLLLRIITDCEDPIADLHQDIYDLYQFPERLHDSYRAEWSSWIKRKLHMNAFQSSEMSDSEALNQYLQHQYSVNGDEIIRRFEEYLKVIDEICSMQKSRNVSPIKTALQKTLERLMRP